MDFIDFQVSGTNFIHKQKSERNLALIASSIKNLIIALIFEMETKVQSDQLLVFQWIDVLNGNRHNCKFFLSSVIIITIKIGVLEMVDLKIIFRKVMAKFENLFANKRNNVGKVYKQYT